MRRTPLRAQSRRQRAGAGRRSPRHPGLPRPSRQAYTWAGGLREAITLYEQISPTASGCWAPITPTPSPPATTSPGPMRRRADCVRRTPFTSAISPTASGAGPRSPRHPGLPRPSRRGVYGRRAGCARRSPLRAQSRRQRAGAGRRSPQHPRLPRQPRRGVYGRRACGEAIPYERNLADSERVLGADHPDTLASRGDLAAAYVLVAGCSRRWPIFDGTQHTRSVRSKRNPGQRLYRVVIWLALSLPAFARILALGSAWLINQRDYAGATFTSTWLIFIIAGIPIFRMSGRLRASRDWKFMSSPWYQQILPIPPHGLHGESRRCSSLRRACFLAMAHQGGAIVKEPSR